MKFIIAILGLLVVFGLAFLISNDKRRIRYRPLAVMIVFAADPWIFLLNTNFGEYLVKGIANTFKAALDYAGAGIEFVFGGIANEGAGPFFLNVLRQSCLFPH